jgi:dTMP kinase
MGKNLIIFEGMDGTGKTTQMKLVNDYLTAQGFKVKMTREPGGTPIGEEIRKLLKSDIEMSKDTEAYLFASSRCEHNIQIKKWIEEGYIVLCDRHFISSYVYQGPIIAEEINKHAMSILKDVDFHIIGFFANRLVSNDRIGDRDEDSDRFEDRIKNEKVYYELGNSYLHLCRLYNGTIIDANYRSIEDINKEVIHAIIEII